MKVIGDDGKVIAERRVVPMVQSEVGAEYAELCRWVEAGMFSMYAEIAPAIGRGRALLFPDGEQTEEGL